MIYRADEARRIATSQQSIFDEIAIIEPRVLSAIAAGVLSVTVGPGGSPATTTGMSVSSTHYQAYADPVNSTTDAHKKATVQMNSVIRHFTTLNYQIRREREQSTNTFNWIVSW